MREFSYSRQSVMFTGKKNQELIRGIDAAARCVQRCRADMLHVIVADWIAAWRASGGGRVLENPGSPRWEKKNPLRGCTFTIDGLAVPPTTPPPADEGGILIPFPSRDAEPET